MKEFLGFVKKEFFHIFRDVRTMLVLFGIPVAQLLIFGYVVSTEIKDVRIAIYDPSRDEATREITDKLLSSGYFVLEKQLDRLDEVEDIFREGNVKEVIVFEPDFARKLERENRARVQVLADASDASTANLIVNYTQGIIRDYAAGVNRLRDLPVRITAEPRMYYNENLRSVFMFVPGTMALILMLVSAMMTSISIAREKEMGSMEVLLVSPLRPAQIVVGKVVPYVVLSFVNAVVIILLGFFVFDMPVKGSLILLLAESLLFICLALSLGILISTMARTQQVAMFISMFALMLPTILLSGFIFPVENMPDLLYWLSFLMPPKYFIIIIKDIMLKGAGIMIVWKETLALMFMTMIFIVLSIKKFKIRLE